MNERIDDIAFRAGCLRNSYSDPKHPDLDGFIVNYETLDKFAELIVQEMLRLLAQYSQDSFPEGIVDDFDGGYLAGLNTAHRAVKNHFGVEE